MDAASLIARCATMDFQLSGSPLDTDENRCRIPISSPKPGAEMSDGPTVGLPSQFPLCGRCKAPLKAMMRRKGTPPFATEAFAILSNLDYLLLLRKMRDTEHPKDVLYKVVGWR